MKNTNRNFIFYDTLIVGGGAAGFFTALNLAKKAPQLSIAILERGKSVLEKVRISGGGRCNVTHAQFVPKELSFNYPRGSKELLGPFHTFMTGDTIHWFEERGVTLKIEDDGRMFPTSDSSQTIIDCFLDEAQKLGVTIIKECAVKELAPACQLGRSAQAHHKDLQPLEVGNDKPKQSSSFDYTVTSSKGTYSCKHLVVTTGSNPKMWKQLEQMGHTITPAVPSLFTFNIKDKRIDGLMGLAVAAHVKVVGKDLESEGPLLITHWGMSGPSILKLSAWGARTLHELDYHFKIEVNWLSHAGSEATLGELAYLKNKYAKQSPYTHAQFNLPKRLWRKLLEAAEIEENTNWGDLSKMKLETLSIQLTQGVFQVHGKSTFKEEFVTAGGINLKEVHFKTFESKLLRNLYLAGEVLNIDAITGGFNFQNAWTGAYHIAQAIQLKNREDLARTIKRKDIES